MEYLNIDNSQFKNLFKYKNSDIYKIKISNKNNIKTNEINGEIEKPADLWIDIKNIMKKY